MIFQSILNINFLNIDLRTNNGNWFDLKVLISDETQSLYSWNGHCYHMCSVCLYGRCSIADSGPKVLANSNNNKHSGDFFV